ncbi:hypothetical protein GCM10009613_15590 [Pseudonocardia kongjuensis]|uniref:HTH araC/xylS-type domain-containing protein n=1 Tax=Pseudonocardia kongjuensis TaxID=102227 RepID=A0ABN1XP08_9PSEU
MPEPPGSPLTRFDLRSTDPEWSNQVLRDAYADFTVTLSGDADGFRFAHTGTAGPGFAVAHVAYSMVAEFEVAAPVGTLHVISGWSGGRLGVRSGRETAGAEQGQPLLMPPERGWWNRLEDMAVDTVSIDAALLERAARSLFGPGPVRFSSMLPLSGAAARYWQGAVAHVRRDVLGDDGAALHPLVLAEAGRSLAAAALLTFPNSGLAGTGRAPRTGRTEPAVVRRALAYIEEHAASDIGVDDVAAAARVGVRGLQHAFRRHRGRTPIEELRRARLARAHAELVAGDPAGGESVAAVAARWGFTHPGRFAARYRAEYGCPPSATLRS